MSEILPFRASSRSKPPPSARPSEIATLAARLTLAETADSPVESMMDLFARAEAEALAALATLRADSIRDAALKLGIVARRSAAADGFVAEGEQALLRSTLRDLLRLAGVPTLALA